LKTISISRRKELFRAVNFKKRLGGILVFKTLLWIFLFVNNSIMQQFRGIMGGTGAPLDQPGFEIEAEIPALKLREHINTLLHKTNPKDVFNGFEEEFNVSDLSLLNLKEEVDRAQNKPTTIL
jgi:hypothetical protein